jgi:hypothetical protein
MNATVLAAIAVTLSLAQPLAFAQSYNIQDFDPAAAGPWSAVDRTTVGVARVPNGSVTIDGQITPEEYGRIPGTTVTPDDPALGGNAWILNYPPERSWDGPADSGFTFWLAHDDEFLYVGVNVRDDVVQSDDDNAQFWRDDAIEIVTDVFFDRFDNNTDNANDEYGGHNYVNFKGRFSRWDEAANARISGGWATGVEWTYGPTGDVYGMGGEVAGGWQTEVRLHKRMFDPAGPAMLRNGHRIGFNIGLDDDDGHGGPGTEDPVDLEIQYFWANRARTEGWNLTEKESGLYSDQEIAYGAVAADPFYIQGLIDGNGRLAHGGTGEIVFGFAPPNPARRPKLLFLTSNATSPINADPHLIALFEGSGYEVIRWAPSSATAEDAQATRDAAKGVDVVFVSETIGSGSVVFDDDGAEGAGLPKFVLKDTDVPIISFEAYMFDDADWVKRTADGSNDFSNWGNSGRSEPPTALQDTGRTSLFIRKPDHPIAAGMTGEVQVYNWPYSLTYGITSADADVVASVTSDGSFPTLFVYEKGDALVDGSIAPNKRIGLFLGQAAEFIVAEGISNQPAGAPRWQYLSEAGRTLLINTVNYAAGSAGGASPTLAIARSGGNLILTYGGGGLQSASSITGPWTAETGASPLSIQPSGAARFYRVR